MIKTRIFLKDNLYGHWASRLHKIHIQDEVGKISWHSSFPLKELGELAGNKTYEKIYLIGFGVEKSQLQSIQQVIEELPTAVYHFASWGEYIQRNQRDMLSIVDEVKSPLSIWWNHVSMEEPSTPVQAVQEYHEYKDTPRSHYVKTVSDLYGKAMAERETFDTDLVTQKLKEKQDYVSYRAETARVENVADGYIVALVYAEQHVNEVAHHIIKQFQNGHKGVIVFVGKHTKGDDLYHIRVTKGLDAGKIAEVLNNGSGKPQAASVFLGKSLPTIFEAVVGAFNEGSDQLLPNN